MDVWVEFKNASKWQAELLFTNFFSEVEDNGNGSQTVHQPTPEEIAAMEKEFAFLEQQQKLEKTVAKGTTETAIQINRPVSSAKSPEKESFVPRDGSVSHPTAGAEAMAAAIEEKTEGFVPPPLVLERPAAPLDPVKLGVLAKQFGEAIPDGEHSVASLQGCEFSFCVVPLLNGKLISMISSP